MNQRIIYEDAEGVHVVIPAIADLNKVIERSIPSGVSYEIVDVSSLPQDRIFRDAWKKGMGKVDVDMPKARAIHMERIRKARDNELEKTDKEVTRETENGLVPKALKDKRQALRDIPQTFDLSTVQTPEELKALWPMGLPNES